MVLKTKLSPLGGGNQAYKKILSSLKVLPPEHIHSKSRKLSLKLPVPVLVAAVAALPENMPGMVRSEALLLPSKELYS